MTTSQVFTTYFYDLPQQYAKARFQSMLVLGKRISWPERQNELNSILTGQFEPWPVWLKYDWNKYQETKSKYYLQCIIGDIQNFDFTEIGNIVFKWRQVYPDYQLVHPASDTSGILLKPYTTNQDKHEGDILLLCNLEHRASRIDIKVPQDNPFGEISFIVFPGFTPKVGAFRMGGTISKECSESLGTIKNPRTEAYELAFPYSDYEADYSYISLSWDLSYCIWLSLDGVKRTFAYYLSLPDKPKYNKELTSKNPYLPVQAFCEYLGTQNKDLMRF